MTCAVHMTRNAPYLDALAVSNVSTHQFANAAPILYCTLYLDHSPPSARAGTLLSQPPDLWTSRLPPPDLRTSRLLTGVVAACSGPDGGEQLVPAASHRGHVDDAHFSRLLPLPTYRPSLQTPGSAELHCRGQTSAGEWLHVGVLHLGTRTSLTAK